MEVADITKPENQVFCKTKLMTDAALSYCPGCGHGTVHNLIMEVLDEMGISEDVIGVAPVGCSVLAYDFMNIDMTQAAHGRAQRYNLAAQDPERRGVLGGGARGPGLAGSLSQGGPGPPRPRCPGAPETQLRDGREPGVP